MRKLTIHWVLAAMLAYAPAAASAAECLQSSMLFPKGDAEFTQSGTIELAGKEISFREYAEHLDSKGNPTGRCLISSLYYSGKGSPQDFEKAAEILLKTDFRFCTPNFAELGAMFKYGLGVAQDRAKATYWFRAFFASSPDLADLVKDMGGFIDEVQSVPGVMIKADIAAALEWLKKELDQPPERLYENGLAYLKNGEARAGFPLADALLLRAARAGHERAALTHARLYIDCKIGTYGRSPRSYLRRFAEAGRAKAAALLGLYYTNHYTRHVAYDRDAEDWLIKALAGDLPDRLRAEAEAALALVKARLEENDRRR